MASKSDKKRSKFFRVAVEGDTTDGRKIERQDILDMAETYSLDVYGSRIWLEHYRGVLPDGPFRAYGDVLAAKAEEVDIAGEKKLALFAQVEPTDDLVNMVNVLRQKLYTSIEIAPNFAGTGKAYLYGLAVTDSPASLGTTMLAFSAKHPDESPLKDRKQAPDNLFTAAAETVIEFTSDEEREDRPGPIAAFLSSLGLTKKPAQAPAKEDPEFNVAEFATKLFDAVGEQDAAMAKLGQDNRALREQVQTLSTQVAGMRKKLDETPQTFARRPVVPGGKDVDAANITDC
ncbi:GPO family capsid scaffolding protein [Stenotrophomonas maltophilia]|uniref:GPO family capsid scaffolding protein n=1 Tax=Stenotrophomonas maltophilia TaxID=40324 RepID=UPI0007472085|nr:GPO family capsid scaffolding protein [Stenotrophomonas maltophilia]KUJ04969.1 phage capsid protein [Stenotrophomonas maltophilia]MBH1699636.1 GPO family capsid scaffolding protein [Stenotrophomonas maltophilia]MBH1710406.1 GPO family capsid scaffolding protein [Stenotrophomonas maltophilia]